MTRLCTYRCSARKTAVVPRPRTKVSRGSALSLACLAASGLTTATVVGSLELAALAAAGAVVAGAHVWRMRRALRGHDTVLAYLGGADAVRTPRGWCSRDGARRVRRSAGGGLVFEEIGADGTARTYRGHVPQTGVRLRATAARFTREGVYILHGRAIEPACFVGLPSTLGGAPYHLPAAYVRLERSADLVRLLRVDERGRDVGETLHETDAEAERQLLREFGAHLGPLLQEPPSAASTVGWEGASPREDAGL